MRASEKKTGRKVPVKPVADAPNQMDGHELLAHVATGSAAIAFFDPQYRGILDKMAYGNEGARQRRRAKLPQMSEETIAAFIREIARALKPSGHLFLWVDKFHLCEGTERWMEGTGLGLVDLVTWNKGRIGMGYRTRRKSEYLKIYQKAPIRARGVWTRHDIPDTWDERGDSKLHAHTKPIGLQAALIEATSNPGDLVIDPAAGSYSVLASCRLAGKRRFLGADILAPAAEEELLRAEARAAALKKAA